MITRSQRESRFCADVAIPRSRGSVMEVLYLCMESVQGLILCGARQHSLASRRRPLKSKDNLSSELSDKVTIFVVISNLEEHRAQPNERRSCLTNQDSNTRLTQQCHRLSLECESSFAEVEGSPVTSVNEQQLPSTSGLFPGSPDTVSHGQHTACGHQEILPLPHWDTCLGNHHSSGQNLAISFLSSTAPF
ncbi:hypothetical protein EK904_004457 [Melospiza melodia maxima]|nr:hypothetical protein EK904_004457 [Melospiza melodia maxima]